MTNVVSKANGSSVLRAHLKKLKEAKSAKEKDKPPKVKQ